MMTYLSRRWPLWPAYVVTAVLLGALVGAVLWVGSHKLKSTWSTPAEAPAVSSVPKVDIAPPVVTAYAPAAKLKLHLPKRIQEDPKQHVLSASRVEPSFRAQTVAVVLDEATGASQAVIRVDPYPWLGHNPSGSLSLSYGLRNSTPVARLGLTQDLIQLKAVNLGGVAHLDSDGAYYVGAGVNFRW